MAVRPSLEADDDKKVKARKSYAAIPWHDVRHRYETTGESFREVASAFGIASVNTVFRRATDEGWRRVVSETAAHLSSMAMGLNANIVDIEPDPDEMMPEPPMMEPVRRRRDGSVEQITIPGKVTISVEADSTGRGGGTSREPGALREEARRAAVGMAQRQTQQFRGELDQAEQMRELSMLIGELLIGALGGQVDTSVADRMRLLSINPDKETIGTLTKSLTLLAECSSLLARRALSLPVTERGIAAGAPLPNDSKASTATALENVKKHISLDVLKSLRVAALEVSRQPVPQQTIAEREI